MTSRILTTQTYNMTESGLGGFTLILRDGNRSVYGIFP